MLRLLVVTLCLVALCVAGLGVRVWLKKNGEFSHRCAAKEAGGVACGSCADSGRHEDCPNYQLHHGDTALRLAQAVTMADEK